MWPISPVGDVVAVVVEDADLGAAEAATDAAFVFQPLGPVSTVRPRASVDP